MNLITFKYISIIIFFSSLLCLSNCARVGNPSGGMKDKLPPVIVSANPDFNTTNFTGNKVKIFFDEYIKLKDLKKQLVISPPLTYPPDITPQGFPSKQITILIKDTLKDNTTYAFNFGNAILDNSEGNILKQFTYLFSTGSYIDSLQLNGNVTDAFNEKTDKDIMLLLYRVDSTYADSVIFKKKPDYISSTQDSIGFSLKNLKEGSYKLFALKEENPNLIYNPYEDKIAFHNSIIHIPTDSIFHLRLFREKPDFSIVKVFEVSKHHIIIAYEGDLITSLENVVNEKEAKIPFIQFKDNTSDSIHLWYKPENSDSIKITFKNNIEKIMRLRSDKKDSLILKINNNQYLHPKDTLRILSNIPLSKINKENIELIDKDSTTVPYKISSYNAYSYSILFNQKENDKYILSLNKGAIISFLGQENDSIQFGFKTKSKEAYADLNLEIQTDYTGSLLIEVLNASMQVVSRKGIIGRKKVAFPLLPPGKYKVRAIFDSNNNKHWDSGKLLSQIQPEKIVYFHKEIDLRANWELTEVFKLD